MPSLPIAMRRFASGLLLLSSLAPCSQAASTLAGGAATLEATLPELAAQRVDDERLGQLRGGLKVNDFSVAFGIDRAVFVNGSLQASSHFQWYSNHPGNMAAGGHGNAAAMQGAPVLSIPSAQMPSPVVIAGNLAGASGAAPTGSTTILVGQSGAGGATPSIIIQNSASDQTIQALTVLNAQVNNLASYRAMRLSDNVTSSLIRGLH